MRLAELRVKTQVGIELQAPDTSREAQPRCPGEEAGTICRLEVQCVLDEYACHGAKKVKSSW